MHLTKAVSRSALGYSVDFMPTLSLALHSDVSLYHLKYVWSASFMTGKVVRSPRSIPKYLVLLYVLRLT